MLSRRNVELRIIEFDPLPSSFIHVNRSSVNPADDNHFPNRAIVKFVDRCPSRFYRILIGKGIFFLSYFCHSFRRPNSILFCSRSYVTKITKKKTLSSRGFRSLITVSTCHFCSAHCCEQSCTRK